MAGRTRTPRQVALRCRIVLAASQGGSELSIAAAVGVNRHTVTLWRRRFAEQGLQGLWQVAPGRGRKPVYGSERLKAVVDATLQTKPKGQSQWSCRLMAQRQGMSKSTISNIWRSHNLKPHRVKTFKLSRDAKFVAQLTDVIALYLNPPERALMLCVDEKSQIQALDRTQPGLPLKRDAAAPGISALPTPLGSGVPDQPGAALGERQLWQPPPSRGRRLAPAASALRASLGAPQLQLDQSD